MWKRERNRPAGIGQADCELSDLIQITFIMNIQKLFDEATRPLVGQMVQLAQARGLEPIQNPVDVAFLSRMFQFMTDEQLSLFAKTSYLISQAVADYLAPRIESLNYEGRIGLGEKMDYWRTWKKIIDTPGLTDNQISQIRGKYDCG